MSPVRIETPKGLKLELLKGVIDVELQTDNPSSPVVVAKLISLKSGGKLSIPGWARHMFLRSHSVRSGNGREEVSVTDIYRDVHAFEGRTSRIFTRAEPQNQVLLVSGLRPVSELGVNLRKTIVGEVPETVASKDKVRTLAQEVREALADPVGMVRRIKAKREEAARKLREAWELDRKQRAEERKANERRLRAWRREHYGQREDDPRLEGTGTWPPSASNKVLVGGRPKVDQLSDEPPPDGYYAHARYVVEHSDDL